MQVLNPMTLPLEGVRVIEASAGTGKTYTIAKLYLRLLLGINTRDDRRLTPAEILVVTFTRAATAELRSRIREDIVALKKQFLDANISGDNLELYEGCVARFGEPTQTSPWEPIIILSAAERQMDASEIHTIHSFCLRLIQQYGLYAELPFDLQMDIDDELLLEVVQDAWRTINYGYSDEALALLDGIIKTPEQLLKMLKPLLILESEQICGDNNFSELLANLTNQQAALKSRWQQQSSNILSTLNTAKANKALSGVKWKANTINDVIGHLNDWADNNAPLQPKLARKLSPDELIASTKKGHDPISIGPISHDIEELIEALDQLNAAFVRHLHGVVGDKHCEQQIARRQLSSDSVLSLCARLITLAPAAVLEEIRSSYPVAMIDEFQDTDPHQYQTFSRLYNASSEETGLLLIGDPKQSIYSFRNADLAVYLEAKANASVPDGQFTMDKNWRSNGRLLSAIESLFCAHASPFLNPDIDFISVTPGRDDHPELKQDGALVKAMQFCVTDTAATNAQLRTEQLATQCATQIANLLTPSNNYSLGERPVQAKDIAVLVRSAQQGTIIKEALTQVGVKSSLIQRKSVFSTTEATTLLYLLECIAQPRNERFIRNAIAAPTFGYSAYELEQLFSDEAHWSNWLKQLEVAHQLWQWKGPLIALENIIDHWGLDARIIATPRSQRAMSNLAQLKELLQSKAQEIRGIDGQLEWFRQAIKNAENNSESHQLRLESDAALVQIVTIHSSKGLEYPLVFMPFANLPSGSRDSAPYIYFDGQQRLAGFDDTAKESKAKEALQEDLRLLYVALTRASSYLFIGLYANSKAPSTPTALNYLLELNCKDLAQQRQRIELLANDAIELIEIEARHAVIEASPPMVDRTPTPFTGDIIKHQSITSYSALVRNKLVKDSLDLDTNANDEDIDSPLEESIEPQGRFALERGAHVGNFLHHIFEHFPLEQLFSENIDDLLTNLMSANSIALGEDQCLVGEYKQWLIEAAITPFIDGHSLRDIPSQQWLAEMEFLIPLKGTLAPGDIQPIVDPYVDFTLEFAPVSGHLVGHIDLVFEHNNRYFVCDYKSNYLGNSYLDYSPECIDENMRHSGYSFQFLIYCVGLHRHLKLSLPEYDYDTHFGGVYYLYLRGMHPDHPKAGIFEYKPPFTLIEQLDHFFAQGHLHA